MSHSPQRHDSSHDLFQELGQLRSSADKDFLAQLEQECLEREATHRAALERAAAEHARVRQSAEVVRQRLEHELEKERYRRENQERQELERIRAERAEQEITERRRAIEEARRLEEIRRQAEALRAKDVEAKAQLERARRAAEEEDARRAAQQASEAIQPAPDTVTPSNAPQLPQQVPSASTTKPQNAEVRILPSEATNLSNGIGAKNGDADESFHEYREIHQRLKKFRSSMMSMAKQIPAVKAKLGDMRREIRKSVGQCTEGKGANRELSNRIVSILKSARDETNGPSVDVRPFLLSSSVRSAAGSQDATQSQMSGLLIYLVNIFAKAILAQFLSEASVSPKAADPVGIVAVQIFASNDFRWHGVSLIDIMMAKFYVVCPTLWGRYGDERTDAGKARVGWWREEAGGPWVSEQRHNERMTGLGAGFAALALRNFAKSRLRNPYPNVHYWQALQRIISVPPAQATSTHFVVLKAMVENYEGRFLELFGSAALAALRKALIDFPNQTLAAGGPGAGVAARAVSVLPDVLKRNRHLTLAM